MNVKPAATALYRTDYHAWAMEQAEALRARRPEALDWDALAEEVADLGKSTERELRSRLRILVMHLLKWAVQPDLRKGGWMATIKVQRRDIADVLMENPSLKAYPSRVLAREHENARLLAVAGTGLPESGFPETCPFTIEQVLDEAFLPD